MTQRDDRLRPLSGNESLFDDPMLPTDSGSMNGATTGTGAMATPVGSGSTLAGIDDPTGEQAFRSSLAGSPSGSGSSQGSSGTSSGGTSSGGASSDGGQSDESGGSSLSIPDPGQAVSAVKSGGSQAMTQANGWIKEHPLVAVGLGLVGGIILGSRGGGGEHHHHYGSHGDQGGSSYQGGSQGQSGGGLSGGLMHLVQQSGMLDNLSSAADRALQIANEQVSGVVRQYVPDFDQHLEEKRSSTSQGAGQIRSGAAGPATRS